MNYKKLLWQVPFLLLLIVGTVLIIRQQHDQPYQHNKGAIFGTTYSITYQSGDDLHDEILAELQRVDASLSMFNETSTISRINRNESVETDEMFNEVFTLAQKVSEETDGAFDMTVAPLVNAWGFGFKQGMPPTPHVIDSLRQLVGYKKVTLATSQNQQETSIVKADPRIMLDGSAIAKGYGCDRVAKLLRRKDIKNYMIEIGGEVVTNGVNPNRVAWRIGVTKPQEEGSQEGLQTILNVSDKAMATSGNYRRFYYKDGKKYAHTIDPKTGHPVQHSLLSATVLAPSCAEADAYATSFMVMGLQRSQELLKRHPELMAYLIYTDAQGNYATWYSANMKEKIVQE